MHTDQENPSPSALLEYAAEIVRRALGGGASEAEVFFLREVSRNIHYRDRRQDRLDISENLGFALRVASAGRQGFAYLSSSSPEAMAPAVEEALASARWGDEPAVPFAAPAASFPALDGVDDESFFKAGEERAREYLEAQIEAAYGVSPLVRRMKRVSYSESWYRSGLVTSRGFRGVKGGTFFSLGGSVLAEGEGEQEAAHEWAFGRRFRDLAVQQPLTQAARQAVSLLGAKPISTGRYTVVLPPAVAVDLLGVFAQALSGEMVAKGKSPLADRVGRPVGSPRFTLIDDGLRPGGYASEPFDDEGAPRRRHSLVDGGILQGFLCHRKSAALLARESTGNGSRGDYKSLPAVRPANLHLYGGGHGLPADRLLEGISRGILLLDVMGAHTLDPVSGNLSLGAAGLIIEGGKPGRPFRGVTVSGNLHELFHRLEGTGDDLRFYGEVGSPSIRLEYLDVAGQ